MEEYSEFNNIFLIDNDFVSKINNIQLKNIKIRPDWYSNISQFYNDYIQPNIFALFAFILISLFLMFRYLIKKDKNKKKLKKYLKKALDEEKQNSNNIIDNNIEDEYLDKYIDDVIENNDIQFEENDIHFEENNDNNSQINKINKYYDDLEKSGLTSSQFLEKEKEDTIKKLNFNNLAKLISGNN